MSDDNNILPEAQAYSDAIMHMRYVAMELKQAAIKAENARVVLQAKLMSEPDKYKIDGMDTGDIEEELFSLMGSYGKARKVHMLARGYGKRLGVAMPVNPRYSEEEIALTKKVEELRLSAPARR